MGNIFGIATVLSVFLTGSPTGDIIAQGVQNQLQSSFLEQKSDVVSTGQESSELVMTGGDSFMSSGAPIVFKNIGKVKITAYSSTPDQTDDSPFIMANGKHVHDGAIAANFLPLGTKVKFPELYGNKVFTVEDRMNKRFNDRMDIWMETRAEAKVFGLAYTYVQIAE